MSAIEVWVRTPWAQALGWALAHSVWQGAAAAMFLAVARGSTRSARARYAAGCLAMALMAGAFGVTWWRSIPPEAASRVVLVPHALRAADPGAAIPRMPRDAELLPWLAPFWLAGVLAFHLRALAAWNITRRLRTTAVCAPPDPWLERLDGLAGRLLVSRPIALLESGLAKTPMVAGYLRPVILMPAGLLVGLPAEQVEAVLLHELAHIRRNDYLANVLQTWLEAIFFYHPAAWWISSVIRVEREHCCDDLVVATQGDARRYATALAALEEIRWSAEPAVSATGGSLVKRIRRLLNSPEGPRASLAPVLTATVLTLAAAAAVFAWQTPPASPYDKWVKEDVAYIISDQERAAFQSLTTNEEREYFIVQFWARRDPTPATFENEYREEHYRRIAYTNERFADGKLAGWKTDRGRIYIMYGPPDELESHPAAVVPFEEWLYKAIGGIRNVIVRFEDPDRSGAYRQTVDPRNPQVVK